METLNNIVLTIQDYMSNIVLIIALLGAGIWFSFRLKFIQIRGFKRGLPEMELDYSCILAINYIL